MAGKRLLDAAKILDAGRSIGKQHITLRQQQWDVYSKTSGLAKAVKSQTDRVTVTAEAAYELAKRFNETAPSWQQQHPSNRPDSQAADAPGTRPGPRASPQTPDGVDFAQSTDSDNGPAQAGPRSTPQTTFEAHEKNDDGTLSSLRKREMQRMAEQQIPGASADARQLHEQESGQDTFYERQESISPELSSLPRVKIPKRPEDAQESDKHVPDGNLNQDVFYSPGKSAESGQDAADMSPDGIFSSPRVSRMMGKDAPDFENPYAGRQKLPPKPLPEMVTAEESRKRDETQRASRTQTVDPQNDSATAADGDAETHKLAESISKEAEVQIAAEMKFFTSADTPLLAPTFPSPKHNESR